MNYADIKTIDVQDGTGIRVSIYVSGCHFPMGEIRVPSDRCWGAQTQRSLENFKIGGQRQPKEIITAFAYLKEACALANAGAGEKPSTTEE